MTHPTRARRPRSRPRRLAVGGAAAALAGGLAITTAGSAAAHVQVVPDTAVAGAESALLTFRVPNENPAATTTRVELTLPTSRPFSSVSVQPLAGWTAAVTEATLPAPVTDEAGATLTRAPRSVTWTAAAGQGLAAHQLQQFVVSVGPLPPSGTVVIPATQTYSDGTVVHGDQPTPASGAEPEHPAPAFTVGAATGSGSPTATVGSDRTARWIGGSGLVVGVLGLIAGAGALLPGRRGNR